MPCGGSSHARTLNSNMAHITHRFSCWTTPPGTVKNQHAITANRGDATYRFVRRFAAYCDEFGFIFAQPGENGCCCEVYRIGTVSRLVLILDKTMSSVFSHPISLDSVTVLWQRRRPTDKMIWYALAGCNWAKIGLTWLKQADGDECASVVTVTNPFGYI